MSLRDQLIAKGLVSKKRAKHLDRQSKQERRARQANKKRAKQEAAEKEKAEREALAAKEAARQQARREAAEAREAHERVFRIRDLVKSRRMAGKGPIPFHFRWPASRRVGCMWLSEGIARELRAGRSAIAGYTEGDDMVWAVVPRNTADRLLEIEPTAVAHCVPDRTHLEDPSEVLMVRSWESSLGPHRVRDAAELARLQAAERARVPGSSEASPNP